MSTVIDVSGRLGEYMLKGWVLTDRICKKCSKVPLMRSPTDNATYFCANCDDGPTNSSSISSGSARTSLDSATHASRSSTPLTDVSEVPSSPTFAPPIDTEEVPRRRQQSDLASTEIGKRLLKGWAMLADECPNSECYGVPLVRPPKSGGEKDPRKECVVCHAVYVDQAGSQGAGRLVPITSDPARPPAVATPRHDVLNTREEPAISAGKGKEVQRDLQPLDAPALYKGPASITDPITRTSALQTKADFNLSHDSLNAAGALQESLRVLTERLHHISSPQGLDVAAVGQTADAIAKVSQALILVQQLQYSCR